MMFGLSSLDPLHIYTQVVCGLGTLLTITNSQNLLGISSFVGFPLCFTPRFQVDPGNSKSPSFKANFGVASPLLTSSLVLCCFLVHQIGDLMFNVPLKRSLGLRVDDHMGLFHRMK